MLSVRSNTGVGVFSADGNTIPSIGLVLLFVDLLLTDYFFFHIFLTIIPGRNQRLFGAWRTVQTARSLPIQTNQCMRANGSIS